jgi:hypothetical protein
MSRRTRSNLAVGLLLILLGGWFLAVQFVPNLSDWFWSVFDWPVVIIIVGICFLVFGVLIGAPGMAVPAAIIGGIGGLLYYQNVTGDWESWAYAWALIPGFVGVGVTLAALLGEGGKEGFRSGLWLVFISLVMFAIFGGFFGANPLGVYWPALLIAFGLWMLVQPLFRRKKPTVVQVEVEEVFQPEVDDAAE